MEGNVHMNSSFIVRGEAALSVAVERCVFVGDFDGCRGLGVNKDVDEGEILFKVPLACTFSEARAKEQLGAVATSGLSDQDCLILGLLSERSLGEQSSWESYIAGLPAAEELDSPLFWTPDELENLQGQAKVRASALIPSVEEAYNTFAAARPDEASPKVSYGEYRWARGILNSRQFGQGGIQGLVPVVDLLNHDASICGGVLSVEGEFICARATRPYRAGEQVFNSYGRCGNAELLVGHGFVVDDNPCNNVELFLDLGSLTGECQRAASNVATAAGWQVENAVAHCKIDRLDPLPEYLVALAQASAGGCLEEGLATLLQQLGNMLEQYPTSASVNEELLQGSLTWRIRCAVVSRAGEQRILSKAMYMIVNQLARQVSKSKLPQDGLEQQQDAVVQRYTRFTNLPECSDVQTQWVMFATVAFFTLYGRSNHACGAIVSEAASKAPAETIFGQRMAFWGSYLAAQFCVTGSLDRAQATTMLMESTDLRNSLGWSIPTKEAVETIRSVVPQPIEVVGSPESASAWVQALKGAGLQVNCGTGAAQSWVVVWPDPGGIGHAGLEALAAASQAEVLVCIGEWEGSTLGLLPDSDARKGGQAWSLAAQSMVASTFTQHSTVQLPSWPLVCDRLAVYRRSL